jgi:dipicolinate synthase subunit A
LGGDARFPYAVAALRDAGHDVTHTAFGDIPLAPEALAGAEAVLLPYPASRDGETLNAPTSPLPVPLSLLFSLLPEGAPVLCGRADGAILRLGAQRPIYDYALCEDFLEKNAAMTAEGAIFLLMQRLSVPLFESRCLILGSGRLARHLAMLFSGMRVPFTVFARNLSARMPQGVSISPLLSLPAEIGHYRVIVNTVPVPILDPSLLMRAVRGGILLELSAVAGVVNADACRRAGLELTVAPSLPGRYAPEGAGRAIADAVTSILSTI